MCPDHFQDIIPDSKYCYMVKADYQYGDGLSWGTAHGECNAYNSKLTSIHSEDEMNTIQEVLKGIAAKDVWIGLQADGNNYNNIIEYA